MQPADGPTPVSPPALAPPSASAPAPDEDPQRAIYEGMLPVRHMQVPSGEREWWEINEQGTILHGERTGATLRLGDPILVRVARVDTLRGRVDLLPAGEQAPDG